MRRQGKRRPTSSPPCPHDIRLHLSDASEEEREKRGEGRKCNHEARRKRSWARGCSADGLKLLAMSKDTDMFHAHYRLKFVWQVITAGSSF